VNISLEIYHGTISSCAENIIRNGILLKKGKPKVDFGQGFYTTQSYDFAKSTAINKTKKTNIHYGGNCVVPTILRYHMNEDMLKDLNVLRFAKEELAWAQFIINNRNGYKYTQAVGEHFHNLKPEFDIVIGSIADNKISAIAKELNDLKEKVTKVELSAMKYSYSTNQISFHTPKGLSCIELVDCDIITTNKQKGVADNE
jgi:hypothetical protein